MTHPSDASTRSPRWSGIRRMLALGALGAVSLLIVACNGDDNGDDGLDGLDGLNGDASPTVTATPTETETDNGTATETATATTTPSGGQGGGATGGDTIQVEMIDIDYSESQIMATAGESLTIEFENTGALEHTFTIDDIDADVPDEFSGDEWDLDVFLQGGESATLTFTPNEAGEYDFYCTIPGHEEAGMVGTLIVE